jgi:hypothetical protein
MHVIDNFTDDVESCPLSCFTFSPALHELLWVDVGHCCCCPLLFLVTEASCWPLIVL